MENKKRYCKHCGNDLTNSYKYCKNCGHEVGPTVKEKVEETKENRKRINKRVSVMLIVAAILILGCIGLFANLSHKAEIANTHKVQLPARDKQLIQQYETSKKETKQAKEKALAYKKAENSVTTSDFSNPTNLPGLKEYKLKMFKSVVKGLGNYYYKPDETTNIMNWVNNTCTATWLVNTTSYSKGEQLNANDIANVLESMNPVSQLHTQYGEVKPDDTGNNTAILLDPNNSQGGWLVVYPDKAAINALNQPGGKKYLIGFSLAGQ